MRAITSEGAREEGGKRDRSDWETGSNGRIYCSMRSLFRALAFAPIKPQINLSDSARAPFTG